MKKVITLFLIVMLLSLISACASQTGKAERNNSGDLPDPASFRQQDRGSNFIETEEFHFCLNDEKVYFSKKDNLEADRSWDGKKDSEDDNGDE